MSTVWLSTEAQGRLYDVPGKTPSDFTIENVPAGKHSLGIAAVDRAGNTGPVASVDFYSDPGRAHHRHHVTF